MAAEILGNGMRRCINVSCFLAPGNVSLPAWGEAARDARLTEEGSEAQQHKHRVHGMVLSEHTQWPENQSVSIGTREDMNISHCLLNKHKETLSELKGYFSFLGRQSNTQMESHLFYETPMAALLLWHKAGCRCSQDACDLSLLLVPADFQTHIFRDILVTSFKSQTAIFNSEKIKLVMFSALCCCAPTMNVLIPCTYSVYTLP